MLVSKTTLGLICLLFLAAPQILAETVPVQCAVYLDENEDGLRQIGEPGIPNVTLTNGIDVFGTDSAGRASFGVQTEFFRFAMLTVPSGYKSTNSWYCPVDSNYSIPDTIAFGLAVDDRRAAGSFSFVHISDTQITTSMSYPLADDIAEINSLQPMPLFIVNTGDIVDDGESPLEWDYYSDQISLSAIEVLHVPGNHDDTPNPNPLDHYERYVGPPYYSFEIGNWHFIGFNSWNPETDSPMQDLWLQNDCARAPEGYNLAIFNHFMVRTLNPDRVQSWVDLGIRAVFSGHHHSTNLSQAPNGIGDYNISYTRGGPRDWTPRLFNIVTAHEDGSVDFDLRRLGVNHRSVIVSPYEGERVPRGHCAILAQLYDTTHDVNGVLATVFDSWGGIVDEVGLQPSGISSWKGHLSTAGWPEGNYTIQITGDFSDGQGFLQTSSFLVVEDYPPGINPDDDWPMLRKSLDGSSSRESTLELPLRVAWIAEVPGMVAQNSPVVYGGKVYLGFRSEKDPFTAGVMAFDAVTGNPLWHRGLNGGVAYAPLAVDGVLIANALNDSVYGFDCGSGDVLWSRSTPGASYANAAPIGDSNGILISSKPYCYFVAPTTGEILWQSEYIGQPWYEFTYSAAAMTDTRIYFNTFGALGLVGGLDILDRATGARIVPQIPGVFRAPAVVGDTLVAGGGVNLDDQYLSARDPSGNVIWSGIDKIGRGMGGVAVAKGIAVTAGRRGDIVAYSLETGTKLWTHAVEDCLLDMSQGVIGGRMTQACPAIAGSTVFVGSIDGNLYALDLETGLLLWKMNLGMPIASSAALSGNMLYVGCSDGNLYAFKGNSDFLVSGVDDHPVDTTGIWLKRKMSPGEIGRIAFEWHLPVDSIVDLCIYDVRGRLVATLAQGNHPGGTHQTLWDGRQGSNGVAASGVYIARLSVGGTVRTQKVTIVR